MITTALVILGIGYMTLNIVSARTKRKDIVYSGRIKHHSSDILEDYGETEEFRCLYLKNGQKKWFEFIDIR